MEQRAAGRVRVVDAESHFLLEIGPKLKELVSYREVLLNLIRKELKLRYRNSILGFLWSMLTPLLYLVVFYVVFNVLLPGGIPRFHVYLLSGLLCWTFFSNGLLATTGSVVANEGLLKKVYFPRELLPLSAVGAGLVHFALQFIVLLGFMIVSRQPLYSEGLYLIPLALAAEVIVLSGLGMFFAALNVKARDIQHFLELGLLFWFWMTPIVYPSALVADRVSGRMFGPIEMIGIYLINPIARVVLAFQRGIYGEVTATGEGGPVRVLIDAPVEWYLKGIGYAAVMGLAFLVVGWWVFHRFERNFAEEL